MGDKIIEYLELGHSMPSKRPTRKKTAKKSGRHYPVVRGGQLEISTGLPGTVNNKVVFVDRELSKANRRLMRHARYYLAKIDLHPDATGVYKVFALRDDWAVQKGLQMAYAMYLESTKEERGIGQSARWEDFRTRFHLTADQLVTSLHDGIASIPLIAGEFVESKVTDDAGVRKSFSWGPASASAYSILGEYDKVGNAQETPDSNTGVVPYGGLNDELKDTTLADLENLGDLPPYDQTGVNANGMFVQVGVLSAGSGGVQRLSTGFFTAPCGIVLIEAPTSQDEGTDLIFEVKAGDYKGVHAPSMME